jgi:hypothetical protein
LIATLGFFTFFNFCAICFLLNLIWFHIELKYRGLTTYEYLKLQENSLGKESKVLIKLTE